jgi:hypothetical protein
VPWFGKRKGKCEWANVTGLVTLLTIALENVGWILTPIQSVDQRYQKSRRHQNSTSLKCGLGVFLELSRRDIFVASDCQATIWSLHNNLSSAGATLLSTLNARRQFCGCTI